MRQQEADWEATGTKINHTARGREVVLSSQVKNRAFGQSVLVDRPEQQALDTSPRPLRHPAIAAEGTEPKMLGPVEPKGLSCDFHREVVKRNTRNEPRFQHLERVFAAVTQPIPSQSQTTLVHKTQELRHIEHHHHHHLQFLQQNSPYDDDDACDPFCRCKCHTSSPPSRFHLAAFRATLGTFSFLFSGTLAATSSSSCNTPSCRSQNSRHTTKYLRLTYTFPAWLLAAAATLTFSDATGVPELALRITRRIPPDSTSLFHSIIGLAWRSDIPGLQRALRARECTVFDARGDDGTAALQFALRGRRYEAAELLLREGADPFQANDKGEAPFQIAVRHLYTSTTSTSMSMSNNNNNNMSARDRARLEAALPMDEILDASALTDLHRVVMGIRPLDVRTYLAALIQNVAATDDDAAGPNAVDDIVNQPDLCGWSPIYYAAGRGDAVAVQALLDAGASPNMLPRRRQSDGDGNGDGASMNGIEGGNPLSIACQEGHLPVVRLLLAAGAEVEPPLPGSLPLVMCARAPAGCYAEIAKELLAAGARWDTEDHAHFNGLLSAAVWDRGDLLDVLLAEGADVNWCDAEGANVLGNAVVYESHDVVRRMLALGGQRLDYAHVGEAGQTVLHLLGVTADVRMMKLFIQSGTVKGMDRDLKDQHGMTPNGHFEKRKNITPELRETWDRLLAVVCGPDQMGLGREGEEAKSDDEEEEDEEFYEAKETVE